MKKLHLLFLTLFTAFFSNVALATYPVSQFAICDSEANLIQNGDFSTDTHWCYCGWGLKNGTAHFRKDHVGSYFLKQDFKTIAGETHTLSFDVSALTGFSAETYLNVYINGVKVSEISASQISAQAGGDEINTRQTISFVAKDSLSYVKFIAVVPHKQVTKLFEANDLTLSNVSVKTNCPEAVAICSKSKNAIINGSFNNGTLGWAGCHMNVKNGQAAFTKDYNTSMYQWFKTEKGEEYRLSVDLSAYADLKRDAFLKIYVNGILADKIAADEIKRRSGNESSFTKQYNFLAYGHKTFVKFETYIPCGAGAADDIFVDNVIVEKVGLCDDVCQLEDEDEDEAIELVKNGDFANGLDKWWNWGFRTINGKVGVDNDWAGVYWMKQHVKTKAYALHTFSFDLSAYGSNSNEAFIKVYVAGKLKFMGKASEIANNHGGNYADKTYSFDFIPYCATTEIVIKVIVDCKHWFATGNDIFVDNISIIETTEDGDEAGRDCPKDTVVANNDAYTYIVENDLRVVLDGSVLNNDTFNDVTPTTLNDVTLTLLSSENDFITIDNTGHVVLRENLKQNLKERGYQKNEYATFLLSYEICSIENPSFCSTTDVAVTVAFTSI